MFPFVGDHQLPPMIRHMLPLFIWCRRKAIRYSPNFVQAFGAFDVHSFLWNGFQEVICQWALALEMKQRNLEFELCHLVHHNHTKAFYALQEKMMPDWRGWKDRLERALV